MSANSQEFFIRLKQERERKNWSQDTISQLICVTQGHYCKIESGYNRLTFKELVDLKKIGIDVYYIFTGVRGTGFKYEAFFGACSRNEQKWMYEIIATIIQNSYDGDLRQRELLNRRITNTRYFLTEENKRNIWCILQKKNTLTQNQMAEALRIDVKKYRRLEKQDILADSDVILHAYEFFQISPMFILKDCNALVCEIGALLNLTDTFMREEIFDYIKLGYTKFIR